MLPLTFIREELVNPVHLISLWKKQDDDEEAGSPSEFSMITSNYDILQ